MLHWLQNSAYADWVRTSWGWPIALTIHAFGMATVCGLMLIIGLRLFGLFRSIPMTSLNKFFPFIWFGVVFQFISGFTLWMTKPADYLGDVVFDIKFSLVIIGVVTSWYFQKYLLREVDGWQSAGVVSKRGLQFTGLVCFVWAFVIITGRLTAYLGTLYSGSGS